MFTTPPKPANQGDNLAGDEGANSNVRGTGELDQDGAAAIEIQKAESQRSKTGASLASIYSSNTVNKLEQARLKEVEKQKKIAEENAKLEAERVKQEKETVLQRLKIQQEAEESERNFKLQLLKAEEEARQKQLDIDRKLQSERLDLSRKTEKILEELSQSSHASSLIHVAEQSSQEKVKKWVDNSSHNFLQFSEEMKTKRNEEPKSEQKSAYFPKNAVKLEDDYKVKDNSFKRAQAHSSFEETVNDLKKEQAKRVTPPLKEVDPGVLLLAEALSLAMNGRDERRANPRVELIDESPLKRQIIFRELPKFDGNPSDYPMFINQFESSTKSGKFTHSENLYRLQKALVDKSPAKEAVKDLLNYPDSVPEILRRLKNMFGQPEHLLQEIFFKIDKMPSISEKNMDQLVEYSAIVANLNATLKSQEANSYIRSPELIRKIVKKLPLSMQFDWTKLAVERRGNLDISILSEWLAGVSEAAVSLMDRSIYFAWKTKSSSSSSSNRVNVHVKQDEADEIREGRNKLCYCCQKTKHALIECDKFKRLSVESKWNLLRRVRKICFNCLEEGHRSTDCDKKKCSESNCERSHHKLLHRKAKARLATSENFKKENPTSDNKKKEEVQKTEEKIVKSNHHAGMEEEVCYKIIPVRLHKNGRFLETLAMLDEGSSSTLIDHQVVEALKLSGTSESFRMRWTGGVIRSEEQSIRCSLEISGNWKNAKRYKLNNVRSVGSLGLPTQTVDSATLIRESPEFTNLPIQSYENGEPLIIIGLDNDKLGLPLEVVEGEWNKPSAIKSRLGWYIYGKGYGNNDAIKSSLHISIENDEKDLHTLVKSFFTTENFGVTPPLKQLESKEDERAWKNFNANTKRIGNRFVTGLLWKRDNFKLPSSVELAVNRFESLQTKFRKDPQYAKLYKEKMLENFEKGFARKLAPEEITQNSNKTFYLPHFGVINPNKPNKIRIVFDAAAKVSGVSLNDFLMKGPDLYVNMLGLLNLFCEGKYAVCGDIEGMFNQIDIMEEDQQSQRFLFQFEDGEETQHCVFTSLLFGETCAPALAQMTVRRNAEDFKQQYSRAVEAICKNHFVDDYLDSFPSEEMAIEVASQVKLIHSKGGFNLRGFLSNSNKVAVELNQSQSEDQLVNLNVEQSDDADRVLGMFWNTKSDKFIFKLNDSRIHPQVLELKRKMTKREFLRVVMSLFDPKGLVGHLIVQAKIILQDVWRSKVDWDDQIEDKDMESFWKWWQCAKSITKLQIPRCYSSKLSDPSTNVQLHVFVDASDKAFSAVAYWRIENEGGVDIALIGSKTKVAPLKTLSIPRLELQAAVLGLRFAQFIQKEHRIKFSQRHFYTDSKTVLCWLLKRHKLTSFVEFRVGEILNGSDVNEWKKIQSKNNVADVATKENKELFMNNEQRWFKGPEFLLKTQDQWPVEIVDVDRDNPPEVVPIHHIHVESRGFDTIDASRFSCWFRLLRSTARVLKAKKFVQVKPLKFENFCSEIIDKVGINDINRARNYLIKKAQWEVYSKEILDLEAGKVISNKSQLKTLSPYLEDGILRVKGRIDKLQWGSKAMKRPIILPRHNRVTFLLIDSLHRHYKHQNNETVVNELRQEYWIPRMRVEVRRVKTQCQQCKLEKVKPITVEMAPLPEARLAPYFRPFTYTGLDYFGPVYVTIGRRKEKRWVALFTCLTIRAVHLEVVDSLSTDSCIIAIRNFINRRGCPRQIHSDNGTNFKGVSKELKKALEGVDFEVLAESLSLQNLEWVFIPPYSPHKGGAWERMVRSVKAVVGHLLNDKSLRPATLESFLIEAENMVNSRPLTYVPLETENDEALTPNHFLLQSSNGIKENWRFPEKLLRKQWKISQELANHFWSRWVREYAPSIMNRQKWFETEHHLKSDDLVILIDEKAPRNEWVKGRVVEVFKGSDGLVRTVKVQTKHGLKTRSVNRISLLKVDPTDC